MTPDQPTATATPRTDYALASCSILAPQPLLLTCRTLERELSSAQSALAEAKAEATAQGEHAVAMTEYAQSLQKELAIRCEEITALRKQDKSAVLADNAALRAEVAEFQAELRTTQTKLCDALTQIDKGGIITEDMEHLLDERDQLRARVADLSERLSKYENTN